MRDLGQQLVAVGLSKLTREVSSEPCPCKPHNWPWNDLCAGQQLRFIGLERTKLTCAFVIGGDCASWERRSDRRRASLVASCAGLNRCIQCLASSYC